MITQEVVRIRNIALQFFKEPHTIPDWNDYIGKVNNWVIIELRHSGFLEVVGHLERKNRGKPHKIYHTVIEFYDKALIKPKPTREYPTLNLRMDSPEMIKKYRAQAIQARKERSRKTVYVGIQDYGSF
jgi:hypothetical protein